MKKIARAMPTVIVVLIGIGLYQAPEWVHSSHHTKVKDALILIGLWLLFTAIAFALTPTRQQGQQSAPRYSYRAGQR